MTIPPVPAWLLGVALLAGAGIGWAVRGFLARRTAASVRALEAELKRKDEDLEAAQALLAETSLTDALTGVHNQRFVDAAIGTLLAPARRATREGDPQHEHVALMLAEIDDFDRIDAGGREVGDALLRDTARALLPFVRGGTVVARWTETAFLVVARIRFAGEARALAARLRASVAGSVRTGEDARPVTLSLGFSIEPLARAHPHLASFRDTSRSWTPLSGGRSGRGATAPSAGGRTTRPSSAPSPRAERRVSRRSCAPIPPPRKPRG